MTLSPKRRRRTTWIALALLPACAPGFPAGQKPDGPDPRTLPFAYEAGHVVLPVRVGSSRPLRFILDTGFSVSAIDTERARAAGLLLGDGPILVGVGPGSVPGRRARGVRVQLEGEVTARLDLVAFPTASLATQSGGSVDGVLGMDFVGGYVVEIDYAARVVRLHDRRTFRYGGEGHALAWEHRGGEWFVAARVVVDGRAPVAGRFRLDTGSGGALALTRPFVEAHRLLEATPGTVEGTGRGVGGASRRRVGRIASLRIGSYSIERPVTAFAQDSAGELARADFAGVIGADVLRRFHVVLDARRGRVYLKRTSPAAEEEGELNP